MSSPTTPYSRGSARVPGAGTRGRASVPYPQDPYRQSGGGRGPGGRGPGGGGWGPGGPGGPSGPGGPGGPYRGDPYRKGRVRPRWGRIALVFALLITLVVVGGGLGLLWYVHSMDEKLRRTDAFAGLNTGRPQPAADGAANFLLLGSDSRNPESTAGSRTDTIMVLHVSADHKKAYFISMPRDLYVYVPQSPDGNNGDTRAKINAAFAWGGTPLMVKTVEGFTGVRIDHVALIDFAGFVQVTDALDGVDLFVEQTVTSIHTNKTFTKGTHHLNGADALDYVRQRKQFPDGDFARMRHQQAFLKAVMDRAASTGTLSNPTKLNAFVKAVTKAMVVDQDFSVLSVGMQVRSIRSKDMIFITSPNLGSDTIDGESVVVSDKGKAAPLYDAVAHDKVDAWLKQNPISPPGK